MTERAQGASTGFRAGLPVVDFSRVAETRRLGRIDWQMHVDSLSTAEAFNRFRGAQAVLTRLENRLPVLSFQYADGLPLDAEDFYRAAGADRGVVTMDATQIRELVGENFTPDGEVILGSEGTCLTRGTRSSDGGNYLRFGLHPPTRRRPDGLFVELEFDTEDASKRLIHIELDQGKDFEQPGLRLSVSEEGPLRSNAKLFFDTTGTLNRAEVSGVEVNTESAPRIDLRALVDAMSISAFEDRPFDLAQSLVPLD